MEKKFGLIGAAVSHSFSKSYFEEKFFRDGLRDYRYTLYPLTSIEELPDLLKENPEMCGLNVTIPYKEQVIPYLSDVSADSKKIGAVNVIKIKDGKLLGFNTDCDAFHETLKAWYPIHDKSKALIMGTGGSSKAVQEALRRLHIPFQLISRAKSHETITYEQLRKNPDYYHTHPLIINTTPLGMHPDTQSCPPINFDEITPEHYVYDLIYNPARTTLLQRAEMRNANIKNGLEMLHLQAEKSWEIWSR